MLIYDRDETRIYAAPIACERDVKTGRRAAEQEAVAGLLREAFGMQGAKVEHHPSGAPYLAGHEGERFEISISHSIGMAVVALAPKGERIGVDCESAGRARQLRRIAARFIAPEDLERWSATDELLYQAWTIKEAAFKASGIAGLTIGDIPLPMTFPHKNETSDSEIAIGGRRYAIILIEAPIEGCRITFVRGI